MAKEKEVEQIDLESVPTNEVEATPISETIIEVPTEEYQDRDVLVFKDKRTGELSVNALGTIKRVANWQTIYEIIKKK